VAQKEQKDRSKDQERAAVEAHGGVEEAFRAQAGLTTVALTRAVFMFIINEPLPFDFVASASFN
jgi:hypothetical protein